MRNFLFDILITFGIIFLIIYCPLAFGSVHIFSFTLIQMVIVTLWLCLLMKSIFVPGKTRLQEGKDTFVFSFRKFPLNYLLVFFIGLILLQLLPLPTSIVKIISPETVKVCQQAWGNVPAFISLSLYRYETKIGLFKILSYIGIFFLLINWADTKGKIRWIVIAFVCIGFVDAIYGMLMYLGKYQHIWWYKKVWGRECVSGTYINRNHFAGLLEMTIPLAFGLLLTMVRKEREGHRTNRVGGIRGWILELNTGDHPQAKKILLIFLTAMMILGLILSASRGGIISLSASFFVMCFLLLFRKNFRKYAAIGLVIALIALSYGLYVGMDYTIQRFERMNMDAESRMRLTRNSLNILHDFPLLGTGWGTYEQIYWRYQDVKDDGIIFDHAHHDWIELGTDMGYIGLGVGVITLLFCLGYFVYLWQKRKNSFSVGIGLGGVGAIISLALHSFTDFNMHIPANALLLSIVIGITLAALTYQRKNHAYDSLYGDTFAEKTSHEQTKISFPLWFKWPIIALIVCVWVSVFLLLRGPYMAERVFPTLPDSTIKERKKPVLEDVYTALGYEKGNAEYFFRLAFLLEKQKDNWSQTNPIFEELRHDKCMMSIDTIGEGKNPGGQTSSSVASKGLSDKNSGKDLVFLALKRAIILSPTNPFYHLKSGQYMLTKSDEDLNMRELYMTAAEKEFERSVYFMPESSLINFSVGRFWLWKSRIVKDKEGFNEAFGRFMHHFQKAYQISPRYKLHIQKAVKQYYPVKAMEELLKPIWK